MVGKIFPYTCFVLVVVRANCAPVRLVGCIEIRSSRLSYRLERSRQRTGANRLWRPVKANLFWQHFIFKSRMKDRMGYFIKILLCKFILRESSVTLKELYGEYIIEIKNCNKKAKKEKKYE